MPRINEFSQLRTHVARSRRTNKKFDVDQFSASEFFTFNGLRLRDFDVFARAQSDPELQVKIKEHLIETDVLGFDSSVSDEEVLASIQNKYDSTTHILARVNDRISQLRLSQSDKPVDDSIRQVDGNKS